MERLTCNINEFPHGKSGKNFDEAVKQERYNRGEFECTAIIERLYEYENTGLTPEEIIQLDKQNEEIQNNNIEYYNLAKDYESQVNKIKEENARLKELLKFALEEIQRFYELNSRVRIVTWRCSELKFDLKLDKNDRQIWKYTDEVEEIFKDE